MRRGRPVKGAALAEALPCSDLARLRLQVILKTLAGELSIEQACGQLNINRSRFHALRQQFLRDAAGLLEPRHPGPVPRTPTPAEQENQRLRQEVDRLKLELCIEQVREELALVLPKLVNRRRKPAAAHKKNAR